MSKPKEMFGMKVSREYKGPAARLLDLLDDRDHSYVGIVFHDQYKNHPALTDSLDGLIGFLQNPMARGIIPLHKSEQVSGVFIYETGKCKSIAELIRQASDLGLSPGPRAGLEMMVQTMDILKGVLRIAEEYAIFSHGGLTPWRVMIKQDGKIQLIGFAVPQVEMLDFKEDPNFIPSEDSFRYAPPERMVADAIEDVRSDIFALALICFELITTRPMYDGSVAEIQEAAQRADVYLRLNQALHDGWMDRYTHDFLERCLRLDIDDRYESVEEALSAGQNLLRNPNLQGMSLFDLMSASHQQVLRQSQEVVAVDEATSMFSRSALQDEEQQKNIAELTSAIKENTVKPSLSSAISSAVSISETTNSLPKTDGASRQSLLDLLRESSSAITVESVKTEDTANKIANIINPQPTTLSSPDSANATSLLSALRASISVQNPESPPPVQESSDKEETIGTPTNISNLFTMPSRNTVSTLVENATVQTPVGNTSNLDSLLSRPNRNSVENIAKPVSSSVPSTSPNPSSTNTASVLSQLLSSASRTGTSTNPVTSVSATASSVVGTNSTIDNGNHVASIQQSSMESNVTDINSKNAHVEQSIVSGNLTHTHVPTKEPKNTLQPADMVKPLPTPSMSIPPPKKAPLDDDDDDIATAMLDRKALQRTALQSNEIANANQSISATQSSVSASIVSSTQIISTRNNHISMPVPTIIDSLCIAPMPLRLIAATTNKEKYAISLGEGMGTIRQTIPKEMTVAQMVNLLLVHRVLPMRSDLLGNISSCYRLMENGVIVSGRKQMQEFSMQEALLLRSVPNSMRQMTIQIQGKETFMQFSTPISVIVPASSIIDYLVSWLRLPQGNWLLFLVQGNQMVEMENSEVLFDFDTMLENSYLFLQSK